MSMAGAVCGHCGADKRAAVKKYKRFESRIFSGCAVILALAAIVAMLVVALK